MSEPFLLPEGTRLVHIGPHKTGSTALQSALDASRHELLTHGVRYAGRRRHEVAAIGWVTGRTMPQHDPASGARRWRKLTKEIRSAKEPRVVLSSEFFSDAEDEAIERIVGDLGAVGLNIAVTLRPLAKILPSQWQQYVQRGLRAPYAAWLRAMFDTPEQPRLSPSFWVRHRHDELIRRWGSVVGMENVTVVVLDSSNHSFLPRAFEQLLGLPEAMLEIHELAENRSLTLAETELMRAFNKQFFDNGFSRALHTQLIRSGTSMYLKQRKPAAGEVRIATPQWALDRASEIGREMVDAIRCSGARVIGDLEALARPVSAQPRPDSPVQIPPAVAARLATGLLIARRQIDGRVPSLLAFDEQPSLRQLSATAAGEVARTIARRARMRMLGRSVGGMRRD